MKIGTIDQKKRLRLPGARPGECFAIREIEEGRYELSKMVPLPGSPKPSESRLRQLLETEALTPKISWKELRTQTREP